MMSQGTPSPPLIPAPAGVRGRYLLQGGGSEVEPSDARGGPVRPSPSRHDGESREARGGPAEPHPSQRDSEDDLPEQAKYPHLNNVFVGQ